MLVAFYRAEAGNLWDKLIAWWTHGPYSHCEFVFSDGMCFSSSSTDGGTRFKQIFFNATDWDYRRIRVDEARLRAWCEKEVGRKYDWFGVLGFAIPFLQHNKKRRFCSEVLVYGLQGLGYLRTRRAWQISPNKLSRILRR